MLTSIEDVENTHSGLWMYFEVKRSRLHPGSSLAVCIVHLFSRLNGVNFIMFVMRSSASQCLEEKNYRPTRIRSHVLNMSSFMCCYMPTVNNYLLQCKCRSWSTIRVPPCENTAPQYPTPIYTSAAHLPSRFVLSVEPSVYQVHGTCS
jgi:hypothetical protein